MNTNAFDSITAALTTSRYLASDADVRRLASVCVGAATILNGARSTYLRVVLAHTHTALGLAEPRLASVKHITVLDKAARAAQRTALDTTASRLYALVLDEIGTGLKGRGAASERHSRTAFARSAASTLRACVSVGIDLTSLGVNDAAKGALAKLANARRVPSRSAPQRKIKSMQRAITRSLESLTEDKAHELAVAMTAQIAAWYAKHGKPTHSAAKAMHDGQPWATRTGVFLPVPRARE